MSQDRKVYCLQACPRTSFSPEILQAGAVKGLIHDVCLCNWLYVVMCARVSLLFVKLTAFVAAFAAEEAC